MLTGGASPETVIVHPMRSTPANSRYLGRPESREPRGSHSETEGRFLPVGLEVSEGWMEGSRLL